jgi:HEAT repeat protein
MRSLVLFGTLTIVSLCGQVKKAGPATPPPSPDENRANQILSDSLASKNPDVRKQAVAALGLIGPREPYISEITGALSDKDIYVRLAAVASIVDLKDKSTGDILEKAFTDDAPEVSFAAAKALYALGDPRGRSAMLAILERDAKTKSNFITVKKRDTLRLFHTPKGMLMFAIKQGVGFAPVPGLGEGVSSLQDILSDAGVSGRATTALLLANDHSAEVLDALKESLTDKDGSVRAAVVHALALRNDRSLLPLMKAQFDDPKEGVRLRAAAGYLRVSWLKPSPARPALPAKKAALPASAKPKP